MFREAIAHLNFSERALFFALRCYALNSILPGTLIRQDGTVGDLTFLFSKEITSLIYKGIELDVLREVDGILAFHRIGSEFDITFYYSLCEIFRKKRRWRPREFYTFLKRLLTVLECHENNQKILDLYKPQKGQHNRMSVKDKIDQLSLSSDEADILLDYVYKFAGRDKFENRILPTKRAVFTALDEIGIMLRDETFYFRGAPTLISRDQLFHSIHKVNQISTVFNLENNNYLKKVMLSVAVVDGNGRAFESIYQTADGEYL